MVIGISGYARTGKNTLANILFKYLSKNNKVYQFALADALKLDLQDFCLNKYGIDSFTEKTEEKNLIRDFLVFHGKMMRIKTNGRYWIDILNNKINSQVKSGEHVIITDIRYDIYGEDEKFWIQNELGGKLIWLEKFEIKQGKKVFTPPANKDEEENGAKLKFSADYRIAWEHQSNTKLAIDLIDNDYLNKKVLDLIDFLEKNYES